MVVRASSGLASRIRMLYDAYNTAKKYEKDPKLTILWEREVYCNIPYYDVFEREQFSDILVKVVEVDKEGYRVGKSLRQFIKQGKIWEIFLEVIHRIYKKMTYVLYLRGGASHKI